jgi:hypothetical protein
VRLTPLGWIWCATYEAVGGDGFRGWSATKGAAGGSPCKPAGRRWRKANRERPEGGPETGRWKDREVIGAPRGIRPTGPVKLAERVAADQRNTAQTGANGVVRSGIRASEGVRSPLRLLQRSQAATVFSHSFRPPRERGSTWSMVEAAAPQ